MTRKITSVFALTFLLALLAPIAGNAQCTTTNATSCLCLNNGQSDCDLLPDIGISGWAIANYLGGPTEYAQTCVPACSGNDGRLRVSGSTPNFGHGSFTVGSVNMWVCGTDTVSVYPGVCGDGSAPRQLIKQKIYHKNGNTMTYTERWAGSMTYHPTHGHMHVDDWGVFTLRIQTADPNPLNWPIVGTGAKLGFCLMDYGTCSGYNGHCRDDLGNVLTNGSFQNWGLGGGAYGCSPVEQGISVGHTDIYSENLDGMWVNIPPGTCNGNYAVVIQVDPNNNFLEEREDNNVAWAPVTLTLQTPAGSGVATITPDGDTDLCGGASVMLTANAGTSYAWSNGANTQSITVAAAGSYTVTVVSPCGTGNVTQVVTVSGPTAAPNVNDDNVCENTTATLTATAAGAGTLGWYDAATGGNLVGTGNSFTTPSLGSTTNYYVEEQETTPGVTYNVGPATSGVGTGANHTNDTRYLQFDATVPFTLVSVWVNASTSGDRTVELRDGTGLVIGSVIVNIPAGMGRITLNLNVPAGNGLRLGLASGSMVDLYRNDAGISFPYTIGGVVNINNSSAGTQYYYFYYDWEIETLSRICGGPRAMATATVTAAPSVSFTTLASTYFNTDPSVALTGSPAGGTFSGPGVSGNSFNPSLAGVGGPYTITYTYTDGNGCVGTSTQDVNVQLGVGVADEAGNMTDVIVFPNPNNGTFTLSFELTGNHQVSFAVNTLTGQELYGRNLGDFTGMYREQISLDLAKGIYVVDLNVDGKVFHQKLTVQ
jgi:Ig-like domain CHU_C associated/Lysyl oxidase